MKFAKELERDLVPEWRIKYLDYKQGKKKCKAISRAIARADGTPGFSRRPDTPSYKPPPFGPRRDQHDDGSSDEDVENPQAETAPMVRRPPPWSTPIQNSKAAERQRLTQGPDADFQYGSFVRTPPDRDPAPISESGQPSQPFELPAPAIKVPSNVSDGKGQGRPQSTRTGSAVSLSRFALDRNASMAGAKPGTSSTRAPGPGHFRTASAATLATLTPSDTNTPRQRIRRMFSMGGPPVERTRSRGEYLMQTLDEVREKEQDLFEFLDSELEKVETFYRQKEDQAGQRLVLLREQLHEMRNRRISEIAEARRRKRDGESNGHSAKKIDGSNGVGHLPLLDPLKAKLFRPGPNSKAFQKMPQTPSHTGAEPDQGRDYVRRPPEDEVPYRTAKRKLKLALQEFYRGIELLKSYALLNRTAFRKLNKKYDKTVNARPTYRYMNEKVNKAWFVNSDVLDGHLQAVEDLYARYFERGNHKIAAGKLRSLSRKKRDESGSAFRNGLLIGVGAVFAIEGVVSGAQLLFHDDYQVRMHTTYLLQIYAGYFLMLYLFSLFCLDCKVWTANRVNYPFIFELDPRSRLDWRQLAEFPSFFLFLFGVFIWLNFSRYGSPAMYLYYPVLLIFITVYRINGTTRNLALFIAFSMTNGIYTAFWDVFMDFSLLQSHARHRYLRDITALKSRWPYYLIMIIDPILRFNWIFYAIFTHDTQHSSLASFFIAFAEVTRRGMWTLLRVENEHCANVAQYKASRDVPLPYRLDTGIGPLTSARVSSGSVDDDGGKKRDDLATSSSKASVSWKGTVLPSTLGGGQSTGVDVPGSASTRQQGTATTAASAAAGEPSAVEEGQQQQAPGGPGGEESLRMRRRQRADTVGRKSITRILADAHRQDFEKKRVPAESVRGSQLTGVEVGDEEEDDDDEDDDLGGTDEGTDDEGNDTGSMLDERMEVREVEMLSRKGRHEDGG
ncbi:Xenotropic and polytropic retrovirus receptor 1 [Cytospora paraplurivora]|uniref:Xenotropic and polytropic retrovirus receptor 1 n=1 Tax=Cytospora paraplurivora TaxID=2898453 RepID=A0AAN9YMP1_9PEZI